MTKPIPFWRTFIACCAANCMANATWWLEPLIVDQLLRTGKLSYVQTGLTISVELIMLAIVSAAAARLLVGRRFLVLVGPAAVCATVAATLSLFVTNYVPYLVFRALVGSSTGIALMVANAALTQLGDADRNFTRLTFVTVLFGMTLVFLMPSVPPSNDHPASLLLLAVTMGIIIPLVLLMPAELKMARAETQSNLGKSTDDRPPILWWFYMVAPLIAIASGIMWSFYAVIGARAGLSTTAISQATATSIFASLGGITLGTALAGQVDRRLAVVVGLLVMGGAISVLAFLPNPLAFRVATCLNVAAMVFVMPFLFATAAVKDPSGRAAAISNSAFFFGGAVAPFIGGLLAETVGISTMGAIAVAILGVALLVYLFDSHLGRDLRALPALP